MPDHRVGTQEEWQAERDELLAEEKVLTRRSDELARKRQALPWVPVEGDYSFETTDGTKSLVELFDGHSQLLIYHFMFGPPYEAGCTVCSSIADTLDSSALHPLLEPLRPADGCHNAQADSRREPQDGTSGGSSRGLPLPP